MYTSLKQTKSLRENNLTEDKDQQSNENMFINFKRRSWSEPNYKQKGEYSKFHIFNKNSKRQTAVSQKQQQCVQGSEKNNNDCLSFTKQLSCKGQVDKNNQTKPISKQQSLIKNYQYFSKKSKFQQDKGMKHTQILYFAQPNKVSTEKLNKTLQFRLKLNSNNKKQNKRSRKQIKINKEKNCQISYQNSKQSNYQYFIQEQSIIYDFCESEIQKREIQKQLSQQQKIDIIKPLKNKNLAIQTNQVYQKCKECSKRNQYSIQLKQLKQKTIELKGIINKLNQLVVSQIQKIKKYVVTQFLAEMNQLVSNGLHSKKIQTRDDGNQKQNQKNANYLNDSLFSQIQLLGSSRLSSLENLSQNNHINMQSKMDENDENIGLNKKFNFKDIYKNEPSQIISNQKKYGKILKNLTQKNEKQTNQRKLKICLDRSCTLNPQQKYSGQLNLRKNSSIGKIFINKRPVQSTRVSECQEQKSPKKSLQGSIVRQSKSLSDSRRAQQSNNTIKQTINNMHQVLQKIKSSLK